VLLSLILGRLHPRRGFLIAQALIMLYLFLLLRASALGWIALAYMARSAQLAGHSLVNAQATRFVDRSRWGLAFGVLETVAWLGAFVGPLAAGRLYARDPALPFQVGLALMPLALLLTYFFSPRPAPGDEPLPLPPSLAQGESPRGPRLLKRSEGAGPSGLPPSA
jgi:predicted MFS family arabinose efflux permease